MTDFRKRDTIRKIDRKIAALQIERDSIIDSVVQDMCYNEHSLHRREQEISIFKQQ